MASLKYVDQRTKDCVNGYIKSCQKLLPNDVIYYHIPELVIHCILFFYFVNDEFDDEKPHQGYILSEDKTIMRCKNNDHAFGMTYLKRAVSQGIHKWTFKCLNVNDDNWFDCIGVCKTKAKIDSDYRVDDLLSEDGYGWIINYQEITFIDDEISCEYGKQKCLTGDVIDMILDLDALQIRFIVNDEDWGIAWKDIEKTEYTAVASANVEDDAIQLISYQCLK